MVGKKGWQIFIATHFSLFQYKGSKKYRKPALVKDAREHRQDS